MSLCVHNIRQSTMNMEKLMKLSLENVPQLLSLYQRTSFPLKGKHVALCLESRFSPMMERVLIQMSRFLTNEWSVILYVTEDVYSSYQELCQRLGNGIQVMLLQRTLSDISHYNEIMMDISFWKEFEHFQKVLIFQTDTMIYRSGIEQFYEYDYVGAPWPTELRLPVCVGNGGFSLRTISAMIDCLSKRKNIKIPPYTQYVTNAKRLKGKQPEDVFFSQGMSQLGYKIPSSIIASSFSIETIKHNHRTIGSHQLDRFAPLLSNTLLINSVMPYFIPELLERQNHRFGWNYVMSHLYSVCTNPNGIYLNTWADVHYLFHKPVRTTKPWVGIFHFTPVHTQIYHKNCNIDLLLQNDIFIHDLTYCKGIFTLSGYMQRHVKEMLASIGFSHIPVEQLYHPVDFTTELFDPDQIDKIQTIISLGTQLRYNSTIYKLKTNHKRIWLPGRNREDCYQFLEDECIEFGIPLTEEEFYKVSIEKLPDDEYDRVLGTSFIIIDLVDASANNSIIECIARNIPCFARRLPAVEEYIGSTYPLLFTNQAELESMLENKELIRSAYQYLVDHPELKTRLRMDTFLHGILQSNITKEIFNISNDVITSPFHDQTPDEITKIVYRDLMVQDHDVTWDKWAFYTKIEGNILYDEHVIRAIKKGKEIAMQLLLISPSLTINYGNHSTFIDITHDVLSTCIESVDFQVNGIVDRKWCIYIPAGKEIRNQLFYDPLCDVDKVIKVIQYGITILYDTKTSYLLTIV